MFSISEQKYRELLVNTGDVGYLRQITFFISSGDALEKSVNFILAVAFSCLSSVATGADHVVRMLDSGSDGMMVFDPGVLRVAIGDTVTFQKVSNHYAVSYPDLIPEGADSWTGSLGEDLTITLEHEGVYVYKCPPHENYAMIGVIVAGRPLNLDYIVENAPTNFYTSKKRLSTYLSSIE